MRYIKGLIARLKVLNPLSKTAIKLGLGLMVLFYIVGFASLASAPYVPNYYHATTLYRGCMEAASASLIAGVSAGFLGDLMLRNRDNTKKKDE